MIVVGAAFDIHTGRVKDAPFWVKNIGLQWPHRLCQEPGRLWKRYLMNNSAILGALGLQLTGLRHYLLCPYARFTVECSHSCFQFILAAGLPVLSDSNYEMVLSTKGTVLRTNSCSIFLIAAYSIETPALCSVWQSPLRANIEISDFPRGIATTAISTRPGGYDISPRASVIS